MFRTLSASLLLALPLAAQNTWIVNPGGGPGVHFTDLPSAVAAAAHGDTIRVQWGPFLQGVTGFTTDKGLTIVGEGMVALATATTPVTVANLPAGRTFRLVGFVAPRDQEMRIHVRNCQGQVHLENLHATEPGLFAPRGPAIHVADSALVTMRDVEDFGTPAVLIERSVAVLTRCRLGVTTLGLGGGPCLHGADALLMVAEPVFQTGWLADAVTLANCHLRLGGSAGSVIAAAGRPIVANGGSLVLDPMVPLRPGAGNPPVSGNARVNMTFVPVCWTGRASPGTTMPVLSTQPPNALVLLLLGEPGAPLATGLGPMMFAQPPVVLALPPQPGPNAIAVVAVPAALPHGSAFVVQALVLHGGGAELSTPAPFVVH